MKLGSKSHPNICGFPCHVLLHRCTKEQFAGIGFQAFHLHDLLPPAVYARRSNFDGEDQPQVDDVGGGFDALAPHVGQQALQ